MFSLKIQHALVAHVEEKVEYAEVWYEAVLALIYLVIAARYELRVVQRVLGPYHVTVVCRAGKGTVIGRYILRGRLDARFYAD